MDIVFRMLDDLRLYTHIVGGWIEQLGRNMKKIHSKFNI